MNYPENIAEKLGFDHIQRDIKLACLSPMGAEFAGKMKFSNRQAVIKSWVTQVHEMKLLMAEHGGEWPQQDYYDLRGWFAPLSLEGHYLTPEDWRDWHRGLDILVQMIRFFTSIDAEKYAEIARITKQYQAKEVEMGLDFRQIIPLIQELDRVFDINGQIKETASPALGDLRRKRFSEEQSLRKKLDSYIQQAYKEGWVSKDFSLTLRNGRMVIPLAAEHKRKIKGFVQDESDTGKTVYLEPADALVLNNEIKSLESAERREIIQILSRLSDRVRPLVPMLANWYQWLGVIDFIRAKALWAIEHDAILPHLQATAHLEWRAARHPILQESLEKIGKKIKPLDITLDEQKRIMVVSGPNAGGKSVTLSTIGLLQYLFQAGCLVPVAEGSTMGFFDQIFLDMGDEQNLENELSTYSSHLSNMRYFLQHAQEKTLLLVDEFGTGTEPSLGGAIAESILEKLAEKGSFGAINTHFGNLKSLADRKAGLFNAAMRYDTTHLEPQFILDMGKPGSSFAFEIAQKIGLPNQIIENARKKLGKSQVDFDKLLMETETEKQIWESKNSSLAAQLAQAERIKEQYASLKQLLEEDQKRLVNSAKAEAKQLIKDANQKIEQTIREIKEQSAEKEATKAIRNTLQEFAAEKLASPTKKIEVPVAKQVAVKAASGNMEVGSWVAIKQADGEGAVGQIMEIKGKDAVVALGSIRSTIKLNRLEMAPAPKAEKSTRVSMRGIDMNSRMAQFSLTLDVRGKRGEEVYVILDQYMNDALLLGVPEVHILHGKGDGILRALVKEQLKRYREIKTVQDEHADRGGAGISIIQFK
jgi:DNA mismatch repair protein MutS2